MKEKRNMKKDTVKVDQLAVKNVINDGLGQSGIKEKKGEVVLDSSLGSNNALFNSFQPSSTASDDSLGLTTWEQKVEYHKVKQFGRDLNMKFNCPPQQPNAIGATKHKSAEDIIIWAVEND